MGGVPLTHYTSIEIGDILLKLWDGLFAPFLSVTDRTNADVSEFMLRDAHGIIVLTLASPMNNLFIDGMRKAQLTLVLSNFLASPLFLFKGVVSAIVVI